MIGTHGNQKYVGCVLDELGNIYIRIRKIYGLVTEHIHEQPDRVETACIGNLHLMENFGASIYHLEIKPVCKWWVLTHEL